MSSLEYSEETPKPVDYAAMAVRIADTVQHNMETPEGRQRMVTQMVADHPPVREELFALLTARNLSEAIPKTEAVSA